MSLELSALTELLAGRRDPLWICSLPPKVAEHLGCSTGAIYLSKSSAEHILNSPKQISPFDLLLLAFAIQNGRLMRDSEAPNKLGAIYTNRDSGRDYFTAMKIAQNGHELWVSSFYPLKARQKNAKLRRPVLL